MTPAHLFHDHLTPLQPKFGGCNNPEKQLKTHPSETRKTTPSAGTIRPRFGGSNGARFVSYFVNSENLQKTAVLFSVRRLIKPTWLNDRDQFLQPNKPLTDTFNNDCLIWMLFSGSNLSASANDLEWNKKKWSLINHFIPFTEEDVGSTGRFESSFMHTFMGKCKQSKEAKSVLSEGKKLWQKYHATQFENRIRDEFKLNRPDVGWYQIRKALEANNENEAVDFEPFKEAYDALSQKLRPLVFDYGFLRK